jgi:hypothetical protein
MEENMVLKRILAFRRILFLKHQRPMIELKLGHQLVTYVISFSIILMLLPEVKELTITPLLLLLRDNLAHLKAIKECLN